MARKRHLSVSIVGAGRVGSVLGRILVENGERVVAVVSRRRGPAQRAARFLRCRIASTKLSAIPRETDLILIATPHAAVEEVAAGIAALDTLRFRSLSVCHASGMLTADVLEPIRLRGLLRFNARVVRPNMVMVKRTMDHLRLGERGRAQTEVPVVMPVVVPETAESEKEIPSDEQIAARNDDLVSHQREAGGR